MPAEASLPTEPDAQPFEVAAYNFPGSAFYYLEQNAGIPPAENVEQLSTEADVSHPLETVGPLHQRMDFQKNGSALDRSRALQCLTSAVYYEAALEPDAGQQAVAQVVLNRVAHPSYPATVCGVVYQGSERATGCQFTFSCDGSLARAPSRFHWMRAARVAQKALDGNVYAPVGLATHYHTTEVHPYWAPSLSFIGTIGAHRFYKWKGMAGQSEAFSSAYIGGEPLPQPKPRVRSAAIAPAADPLQLAREYETARKQALAEAQRQSEIRQQQEMAKEAERLGRSSYSPAQSSIGPDPYAMPTAATRSETDLAGKFPNSGSVRDEYRNSGRWIGTPTQ